MPVSSRIRLLADQIMLSTNELDLGALIFEPGNVNGISATVLRSALIGDLTVDTLQLQSESVTVPGIQTLASNVAPAGGASTTFVDFLVDEFTITGAPGSTIFLQIQADITTQGQNTSPPISPIVRILFNGAEIDIYTASPATDRRTRFIIASVAATGSPQFISIKWQIRSDTSGFSFPGAIAGSRALRVAMKR